MTRNTPAQNDDSPASPTTSPSELGKGAGRTRPQLRILLQIATAIGIVSISFWLGAIYETRFLLKGFNELEQQNRELQTKVAEGPWKEAEAAALALEAYNRGEANALLTIAQGQDQSRCPLNGAGAAVILDRGWNRIHTSAAYMTMMMANSMYGWQPSSSKSKACGSTGVQQAFR